MRSEQKAKPSDQLTNFAGRMPKLLPKRHTLARTDWAFTMFMAAKLMVGLTDYFVFYNDKHPHQCLRSKRYDQNS